MERDTAEGFPKRAVRQRAIFVFSLESTDSFLWGYMNAYAGSARVKISVRAAECRQLTYSARRYDLSLSMP